MTCAAEFPFIRNSGNVAVSGVSFRPKGEIFFQSSEKISRREAARNDMCGKILFIRKSGKVGRNAIPTYYSGKMVS